MLQLSGLRFSVIFLCAVANAEFVPKFHVSLLASHAALPMVTSTFQSRATFPKLMSELIPIEHRLNFSPLLITKSTS
jgi:hypothetical protein